MAHEESVFQQVRDHLPSQGVLRPPAGRVYERFPESVEEEDSDSSSDWDDD